MPKKQIGNQRTYGTDGKQMPPKGMHRMEGGRMMRDEDMPMAQAKGRMKKKSKK